MKSVEIHLENRVIDFKLNVMKLNESITKISKEMITNDPLNSKKKYKLIL